MGGFEVSYGSDFAKEYCQGLTACDTLERLQEYVEHWSQFARDAYDVTRKMTQADFTEYQKGIAIERKGKFAGEEYAERYGAILLPEFLMFVSYVADRFKVPWGVAFIRLRDMNKIEFNGQFWVKKEE
jgi:hypothetical protein